ncbi:hypothetical protein EPO15_16085 [bacterium]|nr:MAG: hypothetical protein EPO15_16085 [bacterium]
MKKAASWLWSALEVVFSIGVFVAALGLLAFLGGKATDGLGRAVDWAVNPPPCGAASPSVTRLLEPVEGGSLLARRRAIAALRCAAPADLVEFDRLVSASRQTGRRRVRAAALEALSRARSVGLKERVGPLAADEDEALAAAALASARGMGLVDADPALAAAFKRRPAWAAPPPAQALSPEAAARFAARVARIEAVVSRADLAKFPSRAAEARKAAGYRDMARIEELLQDPDFIVGGAQAGEALGASGPAGKARAQALARGDDPVLRDVGEGWLLALGER